MEIPSKEDIRKLAEIRDTCFVSLYMPTQRRVGVPREDPIRFKNLLGEAEEGLLKNGFRQAKVTELLGPGRRLIDDDLFWKHQGEGLAIFLGTGMVKAFRLPVTVSEVVTVSRRFHLTPLMALMDAREQFYVLTLTARGVRLFLATQENMEELTPEELPRSMGEVLHREPEKSLQFYTGTPPQPGEPRRDAIFHGSGAWKENEKEREKVYYRRVDEAVRAFLPDTPPLILAGVEAACALYRGISRYGNLVEETVLGSPDGLTDEGLRDGVAKVISRERAERGRSLREDVLSKIGMGEGSDRVEEIGARSRMGGVELLIVPRGIHCWGRVEESGSVTVRDGERQFEDEDLLDFAAVQTIAHGGDVMVADPEELPEGTLALVSFRPPYPRRVASRG